MQEINLKMTCPWSLVASFYPSIFTSSRYPVAGDWFDSGGGVCASVCMLVCPSVKLDKGGDTIMTPFPILNSNSMTLHNASHKINHT